MKTKPQDQTNYLTPHQVMTRSQIYSQLLLKLVSYLTAAAVRAMHQTVSPSAGLGVEKFFTASWLRGILTCLAIILIAVGSNHARGQDEPERYALLVGVTRYGKPELNTNLKFPEKDAEALAKLLERFGFKVDLLVGDQATKKAIDDKLSKLNEIGTNDGVIFVAFCGHGMEFQDSKKSYFCPYDTAMKGLRDADGKQLFNEVGQPIVAPTAESMVAIDDVLLAFTESKAANRILVTDCCRDDPNRARGRSFGSSLKPEKLPIQTVLLLGCSEQQQSLEHDEWGHGALTKCLLEQLQLADASSAVTMGRIAEDVVPAVEQLVKSIGDGRLQQKPKLLMTGRVELKLKNSHDETVSNFFDVSLNPGLKAPSFPSMEFLRGEPFLEFERGTTYVLTTFASWCEPSVAASQKMEELQQRYPAVVFVDVGVWETREDQVAFLEEKDKLDGLLGFAKRLFGRTQLRFARPMDDGFQKTWFEAAGLNAIPTSFLIDPEGVIVWIGHPQKLEPVIQAMQKNEWSASEAKKGFIAEVVEERIRSELQKLVGVRPFTPTVPPKESDFLALHARCMNVGERDILNCQVSVALAQTRFSDDNRWRSLFSRTKSEWSIASRKGLLDSFLRSGTRISESSEEIGAIKRGLVVAALYDLLGRRLDADAAFENAMTTWRTEIESLPQEKRSAAQLEFSKIEIAYRKRLESIPPQPALLSSIERGRTTKEVEDSQRAWARYLEKDVEFTNSIGMKFRLIPPGEFMMGSTESRADLQKAGFKFSSQENNDLSDEGPKHRVKITKALYVAAHETTLRQFLVYYNADRENHKTDAEKDGVGGWGIVGKDFVERKDFVAWNTGWNKPIEDYWDHPVVNVSYNDAMAFCGWLSKKEKKKYRLLTEAEWEYCCRAGTTTRYYSGDSESSVSAIANVFDQSLVKFLGWSNRVATDDGVIFTSRVGSFRPNAFGLFDMHGNVSEFCADRYNPIGYSVHQEEAVDPFSYEGDGPAVRGGNWDWYAPYARASRRNWMGTRERTDFTGFRIVLDPTSYPRILSGEAELSGDDE